MLVNSLSKAPLALQQQPGQKGLNISTTSSAALWSSELSVFLGSEAHQNGMLALLTDLYDCHSKWTYSSLSRGTETLYNVYVTLYAATTPDFLTTSIPADAIGGGLTSRIIFVSQKRPRAKNPWPKLTPQLLKLKDDLIHDLHEISMLSGQMHLTPEAEDFYKEWYNALNYDDQDERFWDYFERKPIHLLKLAMLISLSFGNQMMIRVQFLEMALEILDRVEKRLPEAFAGTGRPVAKNVERIIQQLIEAKGNTLTEQQLFKLNLRAMSQAELEEALYRLEKAGVVKVHVMPGKKLVLLIKDNQRKKLSGGS